MHDPHSNTVRRSYNSDNIDLIALYIPELKEIALIPIDKFTTNDAVVRVKELVVKRKNAAILFSDFIVW